MTVSVPASGGLAAWWLVTFVLAGCDFNSLKSECKPLPSLVLVAGLGAGASFFDNAGATVSLDERRFLVAFARNQSGPNAGGRSVAASVVVDAEGGGQLQQCPMDTREGIDLDNQATNWQPSAQSIAVAKTSAVDLGVVYHRSWLGGLGASPPDEIRFVPMTGQGCPGLIGAANRSLRIDDGEIDRHISAPRIVGLAGGIYAVLWRSGRVDPREYDDRIRARLVRTSATPFGANYQSAYGDPVDLDLAWRQVPFSVAVPVTDEEGKVTRFALLWYSLQGRRVVLSMTLFDQQLVRISESREIDADEDTNVDSVSLRSVAAAYDPDAQAVVVAWVRGMVSFTTVRAGRIPLDRNREPVPLRIEASVQGPASAPTVALLPHGDALVVWREAAVAGNRLTGAVFRPDGRRRFSPIGCTEPSFTLSAASAPMMLHPAAATGGADRLVVAWSEQAPADAAQRWILVVRSLRREHLVWSP